LTIVSTRCLIGGHGKGTIIRDFYGFIKNTSNDTDPQEDGNFTQKSKTIMEISLI